MRTLEIWLRRMLLAAGLFALCGSASASTGAQPDYRMGLRVFNGDDGLPQSGVNAVVQTSDGYLWVGTFGGLARFDGLTFTVFQGDPSLDTPGLEGMAQAGPASPRILALYEDDKKQLWIGTQDAGLSVYRQGAFHHLSICGGICQVNGILQAPDRTLWIATNAGLLNLDPVRKRETWIDPVRTGHTRLARDGQGHIYVAGGDGFFVVAERRLRRIPLPDGDGWVRVLETSGRDLLVGTNRALYRYQPDQGRWQPLGVAGPDAAMKDADGRWWVSTESGQLIRENGDGVW
ncbi:MAG: ligand-binding sensor domain-containing protein, partial [Bradyrhizobium sp.]